MTSNGNGNGGPWWVKAVTTLGVTAVIALLAFVFLARDVKGDMASIKSDTVKIDASHEKLSGMMTAHIDSTGAVLAEIRYLLYIQCLQGARVAKTEPRECVAPQGMTLPSSVRVPTFGGVSVR